MTTRATNERPTRRLMDTAKGPLILEIVAGAIRLRPKGARSGGAAEVSFTPYALYELGLRRRVVPVPAARKR